LTTNRVDAAETVMDAWDDRSHQLVPAMVVDVVESLADSLLDDRAVEHELPPDCENGLEASPTFAPSCTSNDGVRLRTERPPEHHAQLRARRDAELWKEPVQVRAHRPVGEVEPFADLAVRQALRG